MMRRCIGLLLAVAVMHIACRGQEADVQKYLSMVKSGQVDEVRKEIPSLLANHPNDPGVLYVQALVTKDGAESARIYQSIVDNFPKSKYADAALYKVYQFYYALGLYRTAELKLKQLETDYPASPYLVSSGRTESGTLPEELELATSRQDQGGNAVAGAVDTVHAEEPPATGGNVPTGFALQVGAFSTPANAERQKQMFERVGYSVELITKVRDTRTLYVVLVGSFATYEEAKAKAGQIKKEQNVDCMIVSR
jgi:cell division septation protein DedD